MIPVLERFWDDESGVSPVVAVALIIGFTVAVGILLFLFGQGLITGDEDPRLDAEFTVQYDENMNSTLIYTDGDTFTSQNTDRLFITGTNSTGDSYTIEIYDGNSLTNSRFSDPPAELQAGVVAVEDDEMRSKNISYTSTIQVVWEPANEEDTQIILDEIVVPDETTILQQIDEAGSIEVNGVTIIVEGCNPETETC